MSTGNGVPVFTDSEGSRLRTTTWVARGIVAVVSLGLVALATSVLVGVSAPSTTTPTSVGSTNLRPSIAPSVPGMVPPLNETSTRSAVPPVVVSTAGGRDGTLTAPDAVEDGPLSTSPAPSAPPSPTSDATTRPPSPSSSSTSSPAPSTESTAKPGKGNQTTKPKPRG